MNSITPEERVAIDEAISQGRVQRVPAGTSAFDGAMKWDPKSNQIRYCDPGAAKQALGIKLGARSTRKSRATAKHVVKRREQVRAMAKQGMTGAEVAAELGVSTACVYSDARALQISFQRERDRSRKETPDEKRKRRVKNARQKVRDRRRFKDNAPPTGQPSNLAPADAKGTIFPGKVESPKGKEAILKDGANNSKIGGDVLVGRLKGARILTLTLEERATCPRSCQMWRECYGNGMQWSTRWKHGPDLEEALRREVADACAAHEHVLIRLHILGDFYSERYVQFWIDQLAQHSNLTLFGFTAWKPDTAIGKAIARQRLMQPKRFMIRTSGMCAPWGSFTLPYDYPDKQVGDAVVCPEQLDALDAPERQRHCGNCAVCWSSDVPVVFKVH